MNKLIIIIVVLLLCMFFMCKKGSSSMTSISKFGDTIKSKFAGESSSPDDTKVNNITDDCVLIFYAPWCGHCKKSMNDFKNASSKSDGKVILINSDNEPELVKKYNVRGFPTIMKANGESYTGGRDSSSILKFANDK